jgi:hypothetical protein
MVNCVRSVAHAISSLQARALSQVCGLFSVYLGERNSTGRAHTI